MIPTDRPGEPRHARCFRQVLS